MNWNLMVATPAYGCMVHTDYMHAMIALIRGAINANIEVDIVTIGNNSLVPAARNSLISQFCADKKYTHMIFIDADMGLPTNAIPKLLNRNVDIIGVPVPLKGFDANGFPVLNVGTVYSFDETGLAEVEHVGTAILMISKKAALDIISVSDPYYHDPKFSRGDQLTQTTYDVFKIGVKDGHYLPEDYYACSRFREIGYKIYVDYSVVPIHNGMYGFRMTEEHLNHLFNLYLNKPSSKKGLLSKLI